MTAPCRYGTATVGGQYAFGLPSRASSRQWRDISRKVNDADQVIRRSPVSPSLPDSNRTGPTGARSPKPTVVKVTAER